VKLTLDVDDTAALVYSLADVIALARRRTIDGQRYVLLHEQTMADLTAALHGLLKSSELDKDQAAAG
jgi:hypothetical protein